MAKQSLVDILVPNDAYDATGWNANLEVPTKDAIRDVIEGLPTALVPGSDTQVLFNDGGAFGADAGLTYNKTTDTLSIAGMPIGKGSATDGVRIGVSASVSGNYGIAIGTEAAATASLAISIGDVTTSASGAIGIGNSNANVSGQNAILIAGNGGSSTKISSIAIGTGADATMDFGIAIGVDSVCVTSGSDDNSMAIGPDATINNATESVALGAFATVDSFDNSVALGANTSATAANQIALGFGVTQVKVRNATVNSILNFSSVATSDKTFTFPNTTGTLALTSQIPTVSDTAYDATSWNGNTDAPTKNAVRDKIEDILDGVTFTGAVTVQSTSSTQFLVGYDGSNRLDVAVSATGVVSFAAVGSGAAFIFDRGVTATFADTTAIHHKAFRINNTNGYSVGDSGGFQGIYWDDDATTYSAILNYYQYAGDTSAGGLAFFTGSDMTNFAMRIRANKTVNFGGILAPEAGMTVTRTADSYPILKITRSGFHADSEYTANDKLVIGGAEAGTNVHNIVFTDTYNSRFSLFSASQDGTGHSYLADYLTLTGSTPESSPTLIRWAGKVGINTGTTYGNTAATLHVISTTEQLRAGYDQSNYVSCTVGATGVVTLNAVGSGAKFVFSDAVEGPINAYDATSWNGSAKFATEDAVRDKIETLTAGSGITRTVVVTSGSATMGSSAAIDYVYFVAGAHTMSLPAASGNTNRYTVKNTHSANITIDTAGAENIEGVASISIAPEESVDLMSNGTNWFVI